MSDPTPAIASPSDIEEMRAGLEGVTAEPSFWETPRDIPHLEADAAATRLIDSFFKNDAERARVSIPANPDRDDDLLIRSYIRQRMRAEARLLAAYDARGEELAEARLHHATGERITRKDLNNAFRQGAESGRLAAQALDVLPLANELAEAKARIGGLEAVVRTAHVAMSLASSLPGVADEYDFSEALSATEAAIRARAGDQSNVG